MPGAKRRALKKLLSPNSTPSSEPTSGASLAPVDSAQSGASMSSIASDSRNYMTDAELDDAQNVKTELDRMEMRKDSIGSGASGMNIPAPGAAGGVPPLGEDGQGLPPAVADAPTLEGEGDLLAVPSLSHTANANGTSTTSPAAVSTSPSSASLGSSPLGAAKGLYGKMMGHGHGSNGNRNGNDDASEGGAASGAGGGGKKKSSKQKFAERQARKQQAMLEQAPPSNPNWDKQLEKERLDEVRVVGDACVALGRMIHEADNPRAIRSAAAAYMSANPDEFRFFLPSVNGEDTAEATAHDGVMTEKEYAQYCHNVEHTGEWGGEPEIQALSRAFQIPIHVIQRGPPTIVSHGSADDSFGGVMTPEASAKMGDEVVRISYHRRMYGLGEHYNSLRKVAA